MRVALFVEGSQSPPPPRGVVPLERIWSTHLCSLAGVSSFSLVVPISKKHLIAMDPSNPKMSGAGEKLDQLIARRMSTDPFDAAIVAWDLAPAWNPRQNPCRWAETLNFYRLLSESEALPAEWLDRARARWEELASRPTPAERPAPPRIEHGSCLAICMTPMFEDLLTIDERLLKRALGVTGRPPNWPNWTRSNSPDKDLIAPAIAAAMARPEMRRLIRGDYRTRKDEWGELILRNLAADPSGKAYLQAHQLPIRLGELMAGR